MTVWTNATISRKCHTTLGGQRCIIYTLAGISGDTGGTLTTPFSNIEFATVHVQKTTGPAGVACAWTIVGNTVVVAYADPTDTHTIRILVVQG